VGVNRKRSGSGYGDGKGACGRETSGEAKVCWLAIRTTLGGEEGEKEREKGKEGKGKREQSSYLLEACVRRDHERCYLLRSIASDILYRRPDRQQRQARKNGRKEGRKEGRRMRRRRRDSFAVRREGGGGGGGGDRNVEKICGEREREQRVRDGRKEKREREEGRKRRRSVYLCCHVKSSIVSRSLIVSNHTDREERICRISLRGFKREIERDKAED
jgi:hypothetical protein